YTGLRVGIMAAKVFAYATGAALIAVDTFAAIALQAPEPAIRLDVLTDAQQERIYVQSFARDATTGAWNAISPLAIQEVGKWLDTRQQDGWVSGPGLRPYGNRLPSGSQIVDSTSWDPQPGSLLCIGLAKFRNGQRDDPLTVEPIYLRPSAAEEQ